MKISTTIDDIIYKGMLDYLKPRGRTVATYLRVLLYADLSRRNVIAKKGKRVVGVTIDYL